VKGVRVTPAFDFLGTEHVSERLLVPAPELLHSAEPALELDTELAQRPIEFLDLDLLAQSPDLLHRPISAGAWPLSVAMRDRPRADRRGRICCRWERTREQRPLGLV
jgi:hypothetical protein